MIRKLHLYLGTLFAPTILFFAFTGILQTIGLHEAEDVEAPRPAAWIVAIASLHKDQHLPHPKAARPAAAIDAMRADHAAQVPHAAKPAVSGQEADDKENLGQTVLKAFVVLMAIGLMISALLGIVIALKNARTRRIAVLMLMAGTILPVVLLLL